MQSSARNTDKFASVIMAAFLIMGSTHFACRYDIGTVIERFFQKASAETVIVQNSVEASSSDSLAQAEQGIISKSIVRNPFLMPASAMPGPIQQPNANNINTSSSAKIAAAVPVAPAEPQLRGIISKGDKCLAIIEYQGISNYYTAGQNVGNYTINNLNAKSVSLTSSANSLELYVGGNEK